jgi:hypothetical protein
MTNDVSSIYSCNQKGRSNLARGRGPTEENSPSLNTVTMTFEICRFFQVLAVFLVLVFIFFALMKIANSNVPPKN